MAGGQERQQPIEMREFPAIPTKGYELAGVFQLAERRWSSFSPRGHDLLSAEMVARLTVTGEVGPAIHVPVLLLGLGRRTFLLPIFATTSIVKSC